jgi:hypothetical protein
VGEACGETVKNLHTAIIPIVSRRESRVTVMQNAEPYKGYTLSRFSSGQVVRAAV